VHLVDSFWRPVNAEITANRARESAIRAHGLALSVFAERRFERRGMVEENDLGSKHSLAVDEFGGFDDRSVWSPSGNRNKVWVSAIGALGAPGDGSRVRIPGGICTLVTMETPPQEYKLQGRRYRPGSVADERQYATGGA